MKPHSQIFFLQPLVQTIMSFNYYFDKTFETNTLPRLEKIRLQITSEVCLDEFSKYISWSKITNVFTLEKKNVSVNF